MAEENEITKARRLKLAKLRDRGIDPYPPRVAPTTGLAALRTDFGEGMEVAAAGRIIGVRRHGASSFATIRDSSGDFQLYLRRDALGEQYETFRELLDIGDFIRAEGKLFKTTQGEQTIDVSRLEPLAKALRPLPEKWHGLKDTEKRYRSRYLDLISNEQTRERFLKRTKVIQSLRRTLDKRGFLEVETPVLQPLYGGAFAKPFITHHDRLEIPLYLRIADELYLKRLIVGGLEQVYEIGHNFRNEGLDTSHNTEFTMLECYQAYADYEAMMTLTEDLVTQAAKAARPAVGFLAPQVAHLRHQQVNLLLLSRHDLVQAVHQVLGETGLDFQVRQALLGVVRVFHACI